MSQREYAKHRGCALRAVQKAIADERIALAMVTVPGERHPKIDSVKADALWQLNTDAAKRSVMFTPDLPEPDAGKDAEPQADGLAADKQAYHKARAEREQINLRNEQLDLDERLGKLIQIDEAIELGGTTLRTLRDALRNIGARISAQLAVLTEPHDCELLINTEIDACLSGVTVENLMKPVDDENEETATAQGD